MRKDELIAYVKRQLGYPTVNVELTDDQIDDAITKALNELEPWYTVFKYLTVDVTSHCIDLTEYNVMEVTDVIKVLEPSAVDGYDGDVFNYTGMQAYYATPMYAMSRYNTNIRSGTVHQVISSYASLHQEMFYARLATLMQERVIGTLDENLSYKFVDGKLYIDTGAPSTSVVTIEYITKLSDVEDVDESSIYLSYLKDLSVAFSLIVQARVLGKYQVSDSPVTINYSEMRADAERDIERIRDKVINTVSNRFYITD